MLIRITDKYDKENRFRIVFHGVPVQLSDGRTINTMRYLNRDGSFASTNQKDYYNSYRYAVSVLKKYRNKVKVLKVYPDEEYGEGMGRTEVRFTCGS